MLLIDRLRHRHGFGVHSPLAFQGVRRVISPARSDGYYGYHDIDAAIEKNIDKMPARLLYRWRANSRLLLRFCVWMRPQSVWIFPNAPEILTTALSAYNSRLKPESGNDISAATDLVICDASSPVTNLHLVEKILNTDSGMAIVFRPQPGCAQRLFSALPHGLMLHSRNWIILLNRPSMQPVSYCF